MPASRKQPAAAGRAAPSAGSAEDEPSFEEALERLETIVEELEGGSLSLEQSLARYEEGMLLSRRLTQTLDKAEKRIERLVEEEGEVPTTRPFESHAGESHAGDRDLGESHAGEGHPGKGGRATEGGEGELPF
jgi:exodeoxyribonuclease VII small subunit